MKERPDSPGIGAFAFIRGSTLMRAKPTLNNSPSNIFREYLLFTAVTAV